MIGDKTLEAEPRYLSAEEVIALHNMLLGAGDVDPEGVVRDWNLLESVITRPRMAAHYESADLVRQAATLLWGLIENHAFMTAISERDGWQCVPFSSSRHSHLVPPRKEVLRW